MSRAAGESLSVLIFLHTCLTFVSVRCNRISLGNLEFFFSNIITENGAQSTVFFGNIANIN